VTRALDLLAEAQLRIRHGGADARLQLELVAAKLGRPALDAHLDALAGRLEALERAAPAAPGAGPATPAAPAPAVEAPAAPAPAREPVVADREHVERLWPQVLGTLEQEAPHLHGFLSGSRVDEVADQRVRVAVVGEVGLAMLRRPDERARVQAALSELAGRPLELDLALADPREGPAREPGRDEPHDEESLLRRIASEFNAEVETDG
jgi:hypothetical protein